MACLGESSRQLAVNGHWETGGNEIDCRWLSVALEPCPHSGQAVSNVGLVSWLGPQRGSLPVLRSEQGCTRYKGQALLA